MCFSSVREEFTMNAPSPTEPIDSQSESLQDVLLLEGFQVLLVEDCVDQGRLHLKFLQQAGAEVTLECNGLSAVDAVKKSPTRFDAVVMDFEMPKMDGLDATKQLRANGYGGAIIAVTAHSSDELKQSWFHAGCTEYLEKPLKKNGLISTVFCYVTLLKEATKA